MELSLNCLATSRGEEPETSEKNSFNFKSLMVPFETTRLQSCYCDITVLINMLASIQNFENKAQEISTKDT